MKSVSDLSTTRRIRKLEKLPTREEIIGSPLKRIRWARFVPLPKCHPVGKVRVRRATLRAVLTAIAERCNKDTLAIEQRLMPEEGRMVMKDYRVPIETLLEESGIGSRNTFSRAITALIQLRLLTVVSGKATKGLRSSKNSYTLTPWTKQDRQKAILDVFHQETPQQQLANKAALDGAQTRRQEARRVDDKAP